MPPNMPVRDSNGVGISSGLGEGSLLLEFLLLMIQHVDMCRVSGASHLLHSFVGTLRVRNPTESTSVVVF